MKHLSFWILTAVVLTACQLPLAQPPSGQTATLSVSVTNPSPKALGPRTIVPNLVPASYTLSGVGPGSATFTALTNTTGAFSVPDLAYGTWNLTVKAYATTDGTGKDFLVGTAPLTISSPTASTTIALTPSSGTGSLAVNLSWPAGNSVTSVTGTLTPLTPTAGSATNLPAFTIGGTNGAGPASMATITGQAVGTYLLTLVAKNGSVTVAASQTETVQIYNGLTTSWNATIVAGNIASTAKDILTFGFPTMTTPSWFTPNAVINTALTPGTVVVDVPAGTSPTSLIPTFTLSSGATAQAGGVPQTSGSTVQSFSSPVTYTITAEDGSTRTFQVSLNYVSSPLKDLTAFSFTQAANTSLPQTFTGSINTTAIAVAVPPSVYRGNLVASFTASPGATVSVGVANQATGVTPNDFSSPVTYTVTAANGTTKTYTVTVSYGISSTLVMATDQANLYPVTIDSAGSVSVGTTVAVSGSGTVSSAASDPLGHLWFAGITGNASGSMFQYASGATPLTSVGSASYLPSSASARFSKDGSLFFLSGINPGSGSSLYVYRSSAFATPTSYASYLSGTPNNKTWNWAEPGPVAGTFLALDSYQGSNLTPGSYVDNGTTFTWTAGNAGVESNAPAFGVDATVGVDFAWTPDGKYIYVLKGSGQLLGWPTSGTPPITISSGPSILGAVPAVTTFNALATNWTFNAPTPALPTAQSRPLIMDPNGKYLYVVGSYTTTSTPPIGYVVMTFTLSPTTHVPQYASAVTVPGMPQAVMVDPTGTKAFVTYSAIPSYLPDQVRTVRVYSIDQGTGAWSAVTDVPALANPVTAGGQNYVLNSPAISTQPIVDPMGKYVLFLYHTGSGTFVTNLATFETSTGSLVQTFVPPTIPATAIAPTINLLYAGAIY
jgi:hypothetical protein